MFESLISISTKSEKIRLLFVKIILLLFIVSSCKSTTALMRKDAQLADAKATKETKYLYNRINALSKVGYAFGHQDATAYGMGWKNDGKLYKSDVNEVTGDHPAVHGFELGHLELGHTQNLDTVNFGLMKTLIRKAHQKGGIITISWHPNNPVSLKSSWDHTPAVYAILKGAPLHQKYRAWLRKVADFMLDLKDASGNAIPVAFRPFHEMSGPWFWWGEGHCSSEEYKKLWQETFDILTNDYEVHNLLYIYAPDVVEDSAGYLKYYPGDNFVDMLGIDIYHKRSAEEFMTILKKDLAILKKVATDKKMPYALTESGLNMIPIPNWWTQVLDKEIGGTGIAWALFWRNAWPNHYFAPFTGQGSSEDFVTFKNLPHVLFLKDIKKIR
ncbi:glycoside hydrolase family 26 protein [Spongiimicrobium sp. 3-5]|uniref:glycoside hydrolase family 26 protein n=1 Tax=Spongiimicrobium sp. 3-5 TaxID=3332596 RepID=UPI00398137D2